MTIFLSFTTGLFLGALVTLIAVSIAYSVQIEENQEILEENREILMKLDNRYFMKELGIEESEDK